MRARNLLTLALGLSIGFGGNTLAQPKAPPNTAPEGTHFPMPSAMLPNPALANSIARALRESPELSRYQVQVVAHGGIVDLRGEVADETQRKIVLHIARQAPGLVFVRDWMQVRPDPALLRAQAPGPPLIQPVPLPPALGGDKDKNLGLPPRIDGQLPEPMPIFQPMPGPNPTLQPPPLPPYAWPTVAPYNNFSRVAYPQAYPYEQWPFIGPMYPFPRVPLGWRSVSLTWEDGNWWFHRNPTGHDWWRVRYH